MKHKTVLTAALLIAYGLVLFVYLLLRIDPSLSEIIQESQFRATFSYVSEHLNYPGGLIDYGASFLMLFFKSRVIAALIVSGLFFTMTVLTWVLLGYATKPDCSPLLPLVLIPSSLLAAIQSSYDHPLSSTFCIALALLCCIGYFHAIHRSTATRILLFLCLGSFCYYSAGGGGLLLFAALCCCAEIVLKKKVGLAALFSAAAASAPYAACKRLFLVSLNDAYFHGFALNVHGYFPEHAPLYLAGFFPVAFILESIRSRFVFNAPSDKKGGVANRVLLSRICGAAYGLLVAAALTAAVTMSYQDASHATLRINRASLHGRWDEVLAIAQKKRYFNLYTYSAAVQALYCKGSLGSSMFTIDHPFMAKGLFLYADNLPSEAQNDALLFLYRSDIYARLGLAGSAEQWAYEAVGLSGETPRALRRAAEIHIAKGEVPAAHLCLSILKTMPIGKAWARKTACNLERENLPRRSDIPDEDFITFAPNDPSRDLVELLRQKPDAAMPGEYLLLSRLLTGDLSGFVCELQHRYPLHTSTLPRNYEEGFLLYKTMHGTEADRIDYPISPSTANDFSRFNEEMQNRGGEVPALMKRLSPFRNTYWYYYLFALQLRAGQQQ